MPAKASCAIKTRTVKQAQKNGDIYVIERQTQYDPVKKYNVVLSSRIIGKIPKGETSIVSTRPKRSSGEKVSVSNVPVPQIKASRRKIGMMDIIDYVSYENEWQNFYHIGNNIYTLFRDLVLMGQKYRHGNCVAGNRNTGTVYSRNFILEKQEESAVNLNFFEASGTCVGSL